MLFNAAHNPCRLILLVKAAVHGNREPTGLISPELLRLATEIVGDDPVCRIQDRLRRAVVLLERDHLRLRPVTLKVQNVANICTAPGVDGLIVISNHAEIAVPCGELANPGVLNAVRVLILIHVQVLPLGAIPLSDRRCLLK